MAVVISDRLLESSDRLLDAEPDEHLVSLVQTGNDAAFAAIVRRYERELQAQARRLTSDGRGEDAVQQAFLNAFAALHSGSEVRHLRGWLHHILRNEVTRGRVPIDAPLDGVAAYGEPLEDTVQRRATARATLVELSALPDRQRDALLSTAVLGLPRAHVARTMGLSEGAVRQLVHRARIRLRQAATALIPFPLARFFGAARSGVDTAPDAALGAGTAVSGGLVIKVGALLASGVVVTGIAVTHTFPSRHDARVRASGAAHHPAHARGSTQVSPGSAASAAAGDPASVTSSLRLQEHGAAAVREAQRVHGGPGRLSGTRSGRHGGPGSGAGRGGGRGDGGSPTGRGDNGSGRSQGGSSGRGPEGGGFGSGSGSTDGGRSGSGSGQSGSDSGKGQQGGSGSGSGSGSGTGSAGSGSGDSSGSSDGGHGSGRSGGDSGSVSSAGGDGSTSSPSGSSASGSSGSAPAPAVSATSDETSGGGNGRSGGGSGTSGDANAITAGTQNADARSSDSGSGSGGGTGNSSGSRDVSGSLDSSSS